MELAAPTLGTLGLINLYHRFIPNCAAILERLNSMLSSPTKGKQDLVWDDEATSAFAAIKEALASVTLRPKPHALTCIMSDASDRAVGGVLQQQIGGGWQPIAYFSRGSVLPKPGTAHEIENCWLCTLLSSTSATSSKVGSSTCLPTTNR